jgi:hypothetical protein
MFDTLDFAHDILMQTSRPALPVTADGPGLNHRHLPAIVGYEQLRDDWDHDGATAPSRQTVLVALDLALLLTVTGQPIYHTAPGPVGEIMLNLRNGNRSAELLAYPNGRNKFVRLAPGEPPQQGELTPDSLRETLHWLNR